MYALLRAIVQVCPLELHYMAHVCPSTWPMYARRDGGHKALCPPSPRGNAYLPRAPYATYKRHVRGQRPASLRKGQMHIYSCISIRLNLSIIRVLVRKDTCTLSGRRNSAAAWATSTPASSAASTPQDREAQVLPPPQSRELPAPRRTQTRRRLRPCFTVWSRLSTRRRLLVCVCVGGCRLAGGQGYVATDTGVSIEVLATYDERGVAQWVQNLHPKLAPFAPLFEKHQIEGALFLRLTDEMLREMGIDCALARRCSISTQLR